MHARTQTHTHTNATKDIAKSDSQIIFAWKKVIHPMFHLQYKQIHTFKHIQKGKLYPSCLLYNRCQMPPNAINTRHSLLVSLYRKRNDSVGTNSINAVRNVKQASVF